MTIREHDGWVGAFTTLESPLARWKNGERVPKIWGEPGDLTPIGVWGTILGSMDHPELGVAYFIEWDNRPRVAVLVIEKKLAALQ